MAENYFGLPSMGANPSPNSPEMPVGFGMSLAQNADALTFFSSLSSTEKADIIAYIQAAQSGDDAKQRVDSSIRRLSHKKSLGQ